MNDFISVNNMSFSYKDGEKLFEDFNLSVKEGEYVAIIGHNGCGKSTLAKIIMGIVTPTEGEVILDGKNITSLSITERAHLGIGYAFQAPARFKGLTVKRLLKISCGENFSEECCCDLLSKVGLCQKEYLNRPLDSSLSGGELKRIEVASILARNLKIAIYDEPEAGIDLWSFNMLIESFKNISAKQKQSMIIISHQERIMKIADEIAIIANGTVKKKGAVDEVFPVLMEEFNNVCNFR